MELLAAHLAFVPVPTCAADGWSRCVVTSSLWLGDILFLVQFHCNSAGRGHSRFQGLLQRLLVPAMALDTLFLKPRPHHPRLSFRLCDTWEERMEGTSQHAGGSTGPGAPRCR